MTLTAKRALVIAAIALTGCSTDKILQVDRPDIIDPNGLSNPAGVATRCVSMPRARARSSSRVP